MADTQQFDELGPERETDIVVKELLEAKGHSVIETLSAELGKKGIIITKVQKNTAIDDFNEAKERTGSNEYILPVKVDGYQGKREKVYSFDENLRTFAALCNSDYLAYQALGGIYANKPLHVFYDEIRRNILEIVEAKVNSGEIDHNTAATTYLGHINSFTVLFNESLLKSEQEGTPEAVNNRELTTTTEPFKTYLEYKGNINRQIEFLRTKLKLEEDSFLVQYMRGSYRIEGIDQAEMIKEVEFYITNSLFNHIIAPNDKYELNDALAKYSKLISKSKDPVYQVFGKPVPVAPTEL